MDRRAFLTIGGAAVASLAVDSAHAQPSDLSGLSLRRAGDLLRSKTVSPVDLTRHLNAPALTATLARDGVTLD